MSRTKWVSSVCMIHIWFRISLNIVYIKLKIIKPYRFFNFRCQFRHKQILCVRLAWHVKTHNWSFVNALSTKEVLENVITIDNRDARMLYKYYCYMPVFIYIQKRHILYKDYTLYHSLEYSLNIHAYSK